MNILLTSAGRRVSLIRYFRRAMEALGLSGTIVAADLRTDAPALFVADAKETLPLVHSEDYIPALLSVCDRYGIDLVVPLIDTELSVLAGAREKIEEKGARVLVSSVEANEICLDKRNTLRFFHEHGLDTANLYSLQAAKALPAEAFPLFIKPATGSSSMGATQVNNRRELEFFSAYIRDPVIQEFLDGQEYTLDVLVDFSGVVRCVVPRSRIEVRAGEVSKSTTVRDDALIEAGCEVVSRLPGALGCITVQVFRTTDGRLRFVEINPRFGGGVPLSLEAGADYPRWLMQWLLGQEVEDPMSVWRGDQMMLRYDAEIFLDRTDIE